MAIKRSIENVWQSHLQFRSELLEFFFPIKLISYKYASYSFQEVPCIYWSFFTGIFLFTGKSFGIIDGWQLLIVTKFLNLYFILQPLEFWKLNLGSFCDFDRIHRSECTRHCFHHSFVMFHQSLQPFP